MVSTDKAVNPTNVMGATKRMCEMIMQAYSTNGKVKCSATRFGNVLGSAGSVIPLFKRQIQSGGPVTITDMRIIRYFMTIPEASQLVLTSGAMAENGDLFVLDMGQPVKILDLAKNMIRLSGVEDIEIIETGLRPGEKLYEELLVKNDELEKTENDLIFIEHETPVTMDELNAKLTVLRQACETGNDDVVRKAMHQVWDQFIWQIRYAVICCTGICRLCLCSSDCRNHCYAGFDRTYDDNKQIVSEVYVGVDGNPMVWPTPEPTAEPTPEPTATSAPTSES